MTVEEFIEDYAVKRAEELQAEMLAAGSRRPKEWSFVEKYGDKETNLTIIFEGCPFRLKSDRMSEWLWAFLLMFEATESDNNISFHGFNAEDMLFIEKVFITAEINANLQVNEPIGLVNGLTKCIRRFENMEDKLPDMEWLRCEMLNKANDDNLPAQLHWQYIAALLLCCAYIIKISLKNSYICDLTFTAFEQMRTILDMELKAAKEADQLPDFSVEDEYFNLLIKMIPEIESSCDEELIRGAYEFARDYYQATQRCALANEFAEKLNAIKD